MQFHAPVGIVEGIAERTEVSDDGKGPLLLRRILRGARRGAAQKHLQAVPDQLGEADLLAFRKGSRLTYNLKGKQPPTGKLDIPRLRDGGWITNVVMRSGGWTMTNAVLAPAHDVARAHWGGDWRMPTRQELLDVCYNKCDWIPATTNGVAGFVVRGRGEYASSSIFLPFTGWAIESCWEFRDAGFLWASDPRADMPASWRLKFSPRGKHDPRPRCCVGYHWDRFVTVPVRPVRDGAD